MKKIENPHVFISYAWGNAEYQRKVIEFASSLIDNGIDVELDKWSLKEGNDTYAYMEREVLDSKITNVLLLLDKLYTDKANSRSGGVGTETQIISSELYTKTNQDKFLPIVFERGENGEIYKPVYLKGLLHFDLSLDEKYEDEFKRLVRRLYGIDAIEKPVLGKKPEWLDKADIVANPLIKFSKINKITDLKQKNKEIELSTSLILNNVVSYEPNEQDENPIDKYLEIRKNIYEYLLLLDSFYYVDRIEKYFTESLEKSLTLCSDGKPNDTLKKSVLHELLIYAVAIFYKRKEYKKIGYILSKSYFKTRDNSVQSYAMFYTHNQLLNNSMCTRDGKNYLCGMAELWIGNIFIDICTKQDLIVADLIMFNYSMMVDDNEINCRWFPVLYCYEGEFSPLFRDIIKHCKSKEYLNYFYEVFDCNGFEDFIVKIKNIDEKNKRYQSRIRYSSCWHDAPLITDYIIIDEIGKNK